MRIRLKNAFTMYLFIQMLTTYVYVIRSILQNNVKPSDVLWIHATSEYRDRLLHNPDRISSSVISQDTAPDRDIVIHRDGLFPAIYHCKTEIQLLDIKHIPRNMPIVWALPCFVAVSSLTIYPYPSVGLVIGNGIAMVAKQPRRIWENVSYESKWNW